MAEVLIEGPWRHRFVGANGGRFHVAEAGDPEAPMVLLLHGFPQFWWAWRHQLPALAEAGYRAVAMDLRGYGGSDKPPRGYDTATLSTDVAGVIRAMGASDAVVVGHDWGAWVAWSMPSYAPRVTRAVGALSAPHPLEFRKAMRNPAQARAASQIAYFQTPIRPERWLTGRDGAVETLRDWSGGHLEDPEVLQVYRRAMRVPFVAHTSMEGFRWAVRSVPRQDGRRFVRAVTRPVTVPVLQLHGADDPFVLPATARRADRRVREGDLTYRELPGVAHFPHEEAPDAVNDALVEWLRTLP